MSQKLNGSQGSHPKQLVPADAAALSAMQPLIDPNDSQAKKNFESSASSTSHRPEFVGGGNQSNRHFGYIGLQPLRELLHAGVFAGFVRNKDHAFFRA